MATVNEVPRVHRWLKTILAADATLDSLVDGRIYRVFVPKGRAYPLVVFQFLAPLDDTPGNGGERVWSRARYLVKAIVEGNNDGAAQAIADRIDVILEAKIGGAADVEIDYCIRKRPFYLAEQPVDGDVAYIHLGGEYEIAARLAA